MKNKKITIIPDGLTSQDIAIVSGACMKAMELMRTSSFQVVHRTFSDNAIHIEIKSSGVKAGHG